MAFVTTAFLLLINEVVIAIRLNELRSSLQDIDRSEGSIDSIGLVATYEIHKKLFENRMAQDEADAIEQRINSLAVHPRDTGPRADPIVSAISRPALAIINVNRTILGKPPLAFRRGDDPGLVTVDLAYYYERNFHFKKAVELYERSLSDYNLNRSIRAGVLLHEGYCHALSGNAPKARERYQTVIDKYGNESSAITATILLGYLEGFRLAREKALSGAGDPLQTSQNLVNLLAYEQALSLLTTAERGARPEDAPRIRYFMGRCYAGMGDTAKAAEHYARAITSSPSSPYAAYSNRRLFIMASSAGDEAAQKMSMELNRLVEDPVLKKMIRERSAPRGMGNERTNRVKIIIPADIKKTVDALITGKKENPSGKTGIIVIHTSDGNIFKGTLIEETAGHMAIMTSIGRIEVKRDRITGVTGR